MTQLYKSIRVMRRKLVAEYIIGLYLAALFLIYSGYANFDELYATLEGNGIFRIEDMSTTKFVCSLY